MLAAVVTERITARFAFGRTVLGSGLVSAAGYALIALAGAPPVLALGLLTAGLFLDAVANTVWQINVRSLRQAVTPDHLRGRVGGTGQFITWGVIPLGALLGGALGSTIGLRATLLVAAAGMGLQILWLWFSPIAEMRELPPMPEDEEAGEDLVPNLSELEVPLPVRSRPVGLAGAATAGVGAAERG